MTGFFPANAAPTPAPMKPPSDIGVSRTLDSPYFSNNPFVALNAPSKIPISSPIMKISSSFSIASSNPLFIASIKFIVSVFDSSFVNTGVVRVANISSISSSGLGSSCSFAQSIVVLISFSISSDSVSKSLLVNNPSSSKASSNLVIGSLFIQNSLTSSSTYSAGSCPACP